jgi:hypothetical protein
MGLKHPNNHSIPIVTSSPRIRLFKAKLGLRKNCYIYGKENPKESSS